MIEKACSLQQHKHDIVDAKCLHALSKLWHPSSQAAWLLGILVNFRCCCAYDHKICNNDNNIDSRGGSQNYDCTKIIVIINKGVRYLNPKFGTVSQAELDVRRG